MKKILVTGGAGFIGSNFVRHMLSAHPDYDIIVLDAMTYAGNLENLADVSGNPNFYFFRGDIRDEALVTNLIPNVDAVVNFAAETFVDRSIHEPGDFVTTDVVGTFRLLEAARRHGVERFLHISTDEVYGSIEEGSSVETDPIEPRSPYSASKASGDLVVRSYFVTYDLPILITRASNNYGPYQHPEKLVPFFITNAIDNKQLPVYGDGQQVRDWLYVEDHCRAILTVLEAGKCGETYNIGGHNEMPNIRIVRTLCALLDELRPRTDGKPYADQISYVADRPGHDRRYAIDAGKIGRELGWLPQETFDSGIRKTVEWYLSNSQWTERVTSGKYRQERLGTAL